MEDASAGLKACVEAALKTPVDVVAFGESVTTGLAGVVEAGLRVVGGVLAEGAAFAISPSMIAVVPVERTSRDVAATSWRTTAPLVMTAWKVLDRLAPVVDDADAERIYIEVLLGAQRRRFMLWNGVAGLPNNLAATQAVVGAIRRATPTSAP